MDTLSTLVVAWAAVYGYVSLYYCLLYWRRRSDREYVSFGLLVGGMCVFSAGKAALMEADTLEQATLASRFTWLGMMVTVTFFVEFCHALSGKRSRLRTFGYAWGAIGVAASVVGAPIDGGSPAVQPSVGLSLAPDYIQPQVSFFGILLLIGSLLLAGTALTRLVPLAPEDRDVRWVLAGTSITILAGAHDIVLRLGFLRSFYLLEHAAILVILIMSYRLLDRFVRTSGELRARTDELQRSYRRLRRTQEQLVRKEQLAAVGELSAVVAHEIRNPLAIIKNAVSGMRRPNLQSEDRKTLLGILGEETDRLNRLVDDLIAYAQPMVPQDRSVHLDELVWGAVDLARSGNPAPQQVAVTVDLHSAPDEVYGDPALLRQALMNLIDNAVQAMPGGGELTILARSVSLHEQPALALTITDSGEGMDTLVRQKACNPFFTTRPAGTGLGLAIVERVVRNHAGSLSIESSHGEGTTVTLTLPTAPPVMDSDMQVSGGGEAAAPAGTGGP